MAEEILKRLTLPVRKKTERILKLNEEKKEISNKIFISGILLFISSIYIILNSMIYFNALVPLYVFGYIEPIRGLKILDKFFLITLICISTYLYFISQKNKSIINQFENLRISLMKDIGTSFCLCDFECKCKDYFGGRDIKEIYLEMMEGEGIDLII
ncbi:hypothetical protein SAMN02745227_01049 [Anaerobranca californiensis DSM 14826]|jgi:hypothetical protein|uniref:Uncharacterized protein n=1 Tax=Anaerobranca californiensis DSM 14826 TaxID=1120989 RepID=A0A1M6N7T3_9FIRM|nr:hypothetical protein [Anaerobranca californiensis]SHJ91749.1 hypothetical protein SAMN02745227_01049 [Anaerobranca californiensis DSM 14826]